MKSISIIAVIFLITLISNKTTAQLPHIYIYAHALYATPLDNSSQSFFNGGIGGVGGVLVGKKNTRFNASVGYTHFFADKSNVLGDENYIPLKIGIRQYIPFTLHFIYVQGDLGAGLISNKFADKDTRFAYDFGAGVKFTGFEAGLVWDNFKEKNPAGTSSWLTIQAGFTLGF